MPCLKHELLQEWRVGLSRTNIQLSSFIRTQKYIYRTKGCFSHIALRHALVILIVSSSTSYNIQLLNK